MASQMFGITGARNLKRNQGAELNARLGLLPGILQAEQAREQMEREDKFRNRQLKQSKKQDKQSRQFQKQQNRQAFGLEAAKMGVNLSTSDLLKGGPTIGNMVNKFKGTAPAPGGPMGASATKPIGASKPFMGSNLQPGVGVSGGLAGFGVGKLADGKKGKKMLFGAGAGALTGILGGGGLSGIMSGGIGGLFGGLLS